MYAKSQLSVLDVPATKAENCGNLMIQRIQIRNFRCFDNLLIEGLRRFNFIVGESGSGKSALLESLFLLSSQSPELYFRIRRWRGFGEGNLELQSNQESFASLFRYLFHNGDMNSIASLSISDRDHGNRKLDIYFEGKQTLSIPLSKPENTAQYVPITFKWDAKNLITNITLEIKDGAIKGNGSVETHPLHFLSPRNTSSKYDAYLFSSLSRALKSNRVLETIQKTYKTIRSLSLEIVGGETVLNAEMDGLREKIPLNELSGGLNKLVSIALAIAANPNGIVLIDEIENGFYYKNYGEVMSSLIDLCEEYSVQMFASSHSAEFLKDAAEAFVGRSDDFLMLRTKYEKNKCVIRKIEGKLSLSAIEQNAEVRG